MFRYIKQYSNKSLHQISKYSSSYHDNKFKRWQNLYIKPIKNYYLYEICKKDFTLFSYQSINNYYHEEIEQKYILNVKYEQKM